MYFVFHTFVYSYKQLDVTFCRYFKQIGMLLKKLSREYDIFKLKIQLVLIDNSFDKNTNNLLVRVPLFAYSLENPTNSCNSLGLAFSRFKRHRL